MSPTRRRAGVEPPGTPNVTRRARAAQQSLQRTGGGVTRLPTRKSVARGSLTGQEPMLVTLGADPALFPVWLEYALFQVFGRTRSNRSIAMAAGLAPNALYRVLTRGDHPTAAFCEGMASVLGMPADEVLQRAGLRPLVQVRLDATVEDSIAALAAGERALLEDALAQLADALVRAARQAPVKA